MALYTAGFLRRVAAVALDLGVCAAALAATVHAANAFGAQWDTRLLDPFWQAPVVVHTAVERVGEPTTVKHEGGIERTTAFSRETRVYADRSVRIFAVVEGSVRRPDGTTESGRAENLIGESRESYWRTRATYLVGALITFVYYGAFEASSRHATPGKRLLGMRVTGLKGAPLSASRAWFRQVTKLATVAMSGLGYLPALFSQRAQTVHDILAGTLVVTGTSDKVDS